MPKTIAISCLYNIEKNYITLVDYITRKGI